MATAIVKDSHPDEQLDLMKTEGVSLDRTTLNFQTLSTNRSSPRSGQLRGSPTKMLPPVRFNILGKMQRRKSPSPGSQCDSKKSRDSPPQQDGETTGQGVQNTPHKRTSFQLTPELELAASATHERPRAADSPLDFSKKRKLDSRLLKIHHSKIENFDDSPPSPSSHLRNILSMKCQAESDNPPEKVLNLSKESSTSPAWLLEKLSHHNESISADSSSCSPVLVESRNSLTFPPSPSTADITLKSDGLSMCSSKPLFPIANNGSTQMNFAPYGIFPPVSSAHRVNQSIPTLGLPLQLENHATNFSPNLAVNPVHLPASLTLPPGDANSKGRITRPFKAYPKDPMSFSTVGLYGLPLGTMPGTTEALIHQQSNAAYAEFRKQMLSQSNVSRTRRGSHRGILPGSIDSKAASNHHAFSFENESNDGPSSPDGMASVGKADDKSEQQMKDEAYWERRRKNNEAAKRSRDARRAKEDEIAIRAAFLEQENLKLRFELCALKNETAKLRCMLYSS